MLRNEYNIDSALDVVETWIKISGYPYTHKTDGSKHTYIIQHEMGKKWSIYLSELYRFLFEAFELKHVDFDVSNNMLSFVVDVEIIK